MLFALRMKCSNNQRYLLEFVDVYFKDIAFIAMIAFSISINNSTILQIYNTEIINICRIKI